MQIVQYHSGNTGSCHPSRIEAHLQTGKERGRLIDEGSRPMIRRPKYDLGTFACIKTRLCPLEAKGHIVLAQSLDIVHVLLLSSCLEAGLLDG